METEIWKEIPEYEGVYQVSNFGNIKRMAKQIIRNNGWVQTFKERPLKISKDAYGYGQVSLSDCGITTKQKPHRLVIMSFVGDIPEGRQINHINGIKLDNRLENLEIVTSSENMLHSYKILNRQIKGAVVNNKKKVTAFNIQRKSQKQEITCLGIYKIYNSLLDASKDNNVLPSSISACLRGKQKTAGGFVWKYNQDT